MPDRHPVTLIDSPQGHFAAVLVHYDLFRDTPDLHFTHTEAEHLLKCPVVLYDLPNFGKSENMSFYGGNQEWRDLIKDPGFFNRPTIPMPG